MKASAKNLTASLYWKFYMIDNDMLLAISDLLGSQLMPLNDKLDILTEEVHQVHERLDAVEARMDSAEEQISTLKSCIDNIESRLSKLEAEMKIVRIDLLENSILPRLNTIESCYVTTNERYNKRSEQF